MPFVNIPQFNIDTFVARQVGQVRGSFENKIRGSLRGLEDQFRDGCPSQEQIQNIRTQIDTIKSLSVSFKSRFNRFTRLADTLSGSATGIRAAVPVLKGLPIPGLALTAGLTTTFSDLLHLIKEFATQLGTSSENISSLLSETAVLDRLFQDATNLTQKIDTALQFCEIANESNTPIPSECINLIVNGTPEEVSECIANLNNILESNLQNAFKKIEENQASELENQAREEYTSNTGTTYTIKVIQVPSDFTRAPLRQAIAELPNGVKKFESSKSYSAGVEVLKQEVKFRIDNSQV